MVSNLFFILKSFFIPIWGNDPICRAYFSDGRWVAQPPNRSVFDIFFQASLFCCCCWIQFAFLRQLGQSQGYPDCHMAFLVLKYSLLYIEERSREPRHTPKCGWESTFSPTSTLSPIVVKSVELAFLSRALAFFSSCLGCLSSALTGLCASFRRFAETYFRCSDTCDAFGVLFSSVAQ